MLVKRVSFYDFVKEFEKHGRENEFSEEGKRALFDYLNELGNYMGEYIELDILEICCNFTEYNSIEEFNDDYGYDVECIEDINYYTVVIPVDEERFIIQVF